MLCIFVLFLCCLLLCSKSDRTMSRLSATFSVEVKDVKASVVEYIKAGMNTIGNSLIFSLLSALTIATLIKTIQKISENVSQIVDKLSPNFNSPSIKVLRKIPGPLSFPIIGAQWMYMKIVGKYSYDKYHEANEEKLRLFGPVVREDVIWKYPLIHLFDSEDITNILGTISKYPLRPPNEADVIYRKLRPKYYNDIGMVNENGEKWHSLRRNLTPPLSSTATLKHYATHMHSISQDLVNLIRHKKNQDGLITSFKEMIYKAGLEAVCMVALERRMGFLEPTLGFSTQKIMDSVAGFQESSSQLMYGLPFWKYLPLRFNGFFSKLMNCRDYLFETFANIVDETMQLNEEEGVTNTDSILNALLKNVTVKDVKASVVEYITAGMDTIGNSLIFLIANVAQHPEVQEKLHQELDQVFPNGSDIEAEKLGDLHYLKACVKESFRMFPSASQIARFTEKEVVLKSGYVLPPHSLVLCHHRIAALQEQNFTRATEFLPGRWLAGSPEDPALPHHNKDLVLPFGSGKRMCPGKRLAEQELYIIAAKLFQNFNIELAQKLELEFSYLLTPAGPCSLRFTERD